MCGTKEYLANEIKFLTYTLVVKTNETGYLLTKIGR